MGVAPDTDWVELFLQLNQSLGLPAGLKELGVMQDSFQALAQASIADNAHKTNPRVLTENDYLNLLAAAW
jgi:alcohol dehydrogenase class IV